MTKVLGSTNVDGNLHYYFTSYDSTITRSAEGVRQSSGTVVRAFATIESIPHLGFPCFFRQLTPVKSRARGLGSIRVDQDPNIGIHLDRFNAGRLGTTFYVLVSDVILE